MTLQTSRSRQGRLLLSLLSAVVCVIGVYGAGLGIAPARAADSPSLPSFSLPLACDLGRTCWITKLVDVDPGPGDEDYTCGRLTMNGHKGTDIGIRDMAMAHAGVAVLAAADGVVFATRDGMDDVNVTRLTDAQREAMSSSACGNAVVLDHGNGWRTIYCHMMKGSIAVSRGDRVSRGDPLGRVGMSGFAEHPHLHFGITKNGAVVDPFLGSNPSQTCGAPTSPLWTDAALKAMPYRPLVINGLGIADHRPTRQESRDALLTARSIPDTAPMLITWADIFGLEPGDTVDMHMVAPDGQNLISHQETRDKETLQFFTFAGRKLSERIPRWQPGLYTLTVTVARPSSSGSPGTTTTDAAIQATKTQATKTMTIAVRPTP